MIQPGFAVAGLEHLFDPMPLPLATGPPQAKVTSGPALVRA